MATKTETPQPDTPPTDATRVRDLRVTPGGVLPKSVQTWLMVGLAFVIVLIILITGHASDPARSGTNVHPPEPTLAPADRIRSYQQQLADAEARQRDTGGTATAEGRGAGPSKAPRASGVSTDEASRREAQSLFADNIALSRRPAGQQPFAESSAPTAVASSGPSPASSPELALLERALAQVPPTAAPRPEPSPAVPSAGTTAAASGRTPIAAAEPEVEQYPAAGERRRLLEGTVIEATLVNRLDGTFAGPVVGLVTTPVYAPDREAVLIPAGARVMGSAAPVQSWGDTRLALSFHRLLMPDGHTYSLNHFTGLDQIGETGLRDAVNRHYLQVFGASLAIGALSGLAQYGTRSTAGVYDFGTEYRQATGASLATSASRVLDRYLNVLPTVTIREGTRFKVYLTSDLALPVYAATTGGLR
jgi:type IV secretion system protein TrbI